MACGLAGRQSAGWAGACGPKPQAATKAPRVGSNAPPLAWAQCRPACNTVLRSAGNACQVSAGARLNWARVESACQWLMWRTTLASTSSMALRRVCSGKNCGLPTRTRQCVPMLVPFRLCSVSGSARRRRWGAAKVGKAGAACAKLTFFKRGACSAEFTGFSSFKASKE